ncbi:aminobenzoyl-glutamate utilization protein B [Octadecabacter temperatus]|uniref:p-aminobenzoyl-glutamate hydrolase subunit B n=1 Tax=Octadecabacter temperatus TaxID=1458307 RepID=A0A0K0Y3L7_9RHOB|nr:peptidase M20 [Octadecabacter temperatus]AKS45476.1 p-aminobenzoyl-glutamate hydrolase subunit B [Octadecabacter temperatus]SIN93759.1 aminobenzoyl-glutamate utilization protein B [Octadecabacter temperatus]
MSVSAAQSSALAWIENARDGLSEDCARIFSYGEPAWREYRSAEWYVERLRAEGFTVEEGSGGMPTAFCAEWSNGAGPVVGMYAEYDAVPGNCQAAVVREAPRDGLSAYAAGHTDPHSALGISGLGGLLATKAAMEQHGIKGGLRFTGEPAEKVRGSKPIHAAKGYYDGLAGMLSFHPFYMLPMCNTVRWDTHCGAAYSMIYRFICDAPHLFGASDGAPIPQSHSDIRAPGANDALVMMYSQARMLRDTMLPNVGGWSISESIISTGQATADNLPAGLAELQYMMRVPTVEMAESVSARLDALAESVAAQTGCRVERHWVCKSRPGLANHAMANVVWEQIQQVGAPVWDTGAKALMKQVQENCGVTADDDPILPACETLISPQNAEAILRESLPPNQRNSTSDDYTDMTWHAPTARFYIARPALKGGPYPSWAMNALGGMPQTIDPMVQVAAKVLACSALRLMEDEGARAATQSEFQRRKAEHDIPPLCDYPSPHGFKWPEYVQTSRGEDWHIPKLETK